LSRNNANLFADLPPTRLPEELCQILWQTGSVRLERIVSHGHITPAGQWYDQDTDEWVVLLRGAATLCLEGEELLQMQPGDHVLLPAHRRHRVEWTDPQQPTIWLAVHVLCDSETSK